MSHFIKVAFALGIVAFPGTSIVQASQGKQAAQIELPFDRAGYVHHSLATGCDLNGRAVKSQSPDCVRVIYAGGAGVDG